MISLKNIEKTYRNDLGWYSVIKEVSLEIKTGEFIIIVGKSGSGKSTLLNIITGVDKPSKGEITVNKSDIKDLNEEKMSEWRGNNIGIVFQFFQLIPTLSVLENILLPMDLVKKIPQKNRTFRAYELLERVGLSEHANKMPHALSGGEQQRVAIVRAMSNDAPIIVADEPTGNLDSKNTEAVFNLFHMLKNEGKTIVMATHERNIIKGVDKRILISDGEITEETNFHMGVNSI